jgi:hypothetical protein
MHARIDLRRVQSARADSDASTGVAHVARLRELCEGYAAACAACKTGDIADEDLADQSPRVLLTVWHAASAAAAAAAATADATADVTAIAAAATMIAAPAPLLSLPLQLRIEFGEAFFAPGELDVTRALRLRAHHPLVAGRPQLVRSERHLDNTCTVQMRQTVACGAQCARRVGTPSERFRVRTVSCT